MKKVNFDAVYEMLKAEMTFSSQRNICEVIQQKVHKGINLVSGRHSKEKQTN